MRNLKWILLGIYLILAGLAFWVCISVSASLISSQVSVPVVAGILFLINR